MYLHDILTVSTYFYNPMILGSAGAIEAQACMPGWLYPILMAVSGLLKEASSFWHLSVCLVFTIFEHQHKNHELSDSTG